MFPRDRKYLLLVLAISTISLAYWLVFSWNLMSTFHEDVDLGLMAWNMYYYAHYTGQVFGLQLVVFGSHIAMDQLLVLPFYYLFQSPFTLLVVQDVVLTVTAIVIYLVSKDLVKDNRIALAFFIAFIVNPGVWGIIIYNYHTEMLIPLFYILTFYFLMKTDTKLLLISLLLLLGVIEEAPLLAVTLAIGMLSYDYIFTTDRRLKRKRMELSALVLVVSVAVFWIYMSITSALPYSYSPGGEYAAVPPALRINAFVQGEVSQIMSPLVTLYGILWTPSNQAFVVFGLLLATAGFGIFFFFDPVTSFFLISPWLAVIFLTGNNTFLDINFQYYSYVIGGTFVGALLGILAVKSKRGPVSRRIFGRLGAPHSDGRVLSLAFYSTLIIAVALFFVSIHFRMPVNVGTDLSRVFLFQSEWQPYVGQIDSMLKLVPNNSTLLTILCVMPLASNRQYLEQTVWPADNVYKPQYILVDFDSNNITSVGYMLQEQRAYVDDYIKNSSDYSLYARNGSALLIRQADVTAPINETKLIELINSTVTQ
ncbi:MAG: DUF2079 domain-containing protein [Candidatus Marsarchaeota archaeon]|nr:DUF2079 domain-containing protein [Candidatus Marsarchaeota archaeon]